MLSAIMTTSMYSSIFQHTTVVRLGIIACMILLDLFFCGARYRSKKVLLLHIVLAGACLVLVAASAQLSQYWLAQVLAIAYCARSFDTRYLIKIWCISVSASILFIIASCLVGVIPDYITDTRGLFGRHSLGFNYSTFLSHYYLAIVLCIGYLKRFRFSVLQLSSLLLVDVLVFLITNSRNSCLLVVIVLAISVIIQIGREGSPGSSRFSLFCLKYSVPICFVISVLLLLVIDPQGALGLRLDGVLSGRIRLTHEAFKMYPVTMLGNDIHWSTYHLLSNGTMAIGYVDKDGVFTAMRYMFVDCSYLKDLLSYGWFPFALMMVLSTAVSMYAVRNGDRALAFLVAIIAVHAIIDPQFLLLYYSPHLILLAKPWFELCHRKRFRSNLVIERSVVKQKRIA